MSDTTRKLTVSFGAFSCTLAGFDDPFPIMKQVVDYFQDLSARDPSFGAYPERPDPNALQAIAAAEADGPVSAEVDGTAVLLRRIADEAPAEEGADAPIWDDYDVAPAAAATTGLALSATADALQAEDGFGSDDESDETLEDFELDTDHAVEDLPEDDLVAAVDDAMDETVETAEDAGEDLVAEAEDTDLALEDEADGDTFDAEDFAEPDATDIDEATEIEATEDATYDEPDADDIAAARDADDFAEPEETAETLVEDEGETLPDWAAELISDSSPEGAEEPSDAAEPLELAETDLSDDDLDEDLADAFEEADDSLAEAIADASDEAPLQLGEAIAEADVEDMAEAIEDAPEDLEEFATDRDGDMDAFGREIAEALREDDPASEPVETERPAPLALTPDPSTQAAIAEEEAALRRVLSSKGNDEDPDLAPSNPLARLRARIANKARSLAGNENTDAPAPLRLGPAPTPEPEAPAAEAAEDAPMVNFDDDVPVVADVSLPKPQNRPDPLVLDAAEPQAESGEVLHLVPSELDAPDAEDGAQDLKRFASSMGAATLPELLEASAAYVTLVNGRPSFSRREIFSLFDTLNEEGEISHEDRIKTFSRLLRSGVIERTTDGSFAMSRAAREQYQDRASA